MGARQRWRQRIESESETWMNRIIETLSKTKEISDWKINIHRRESYELFFVKGKVETVRRTDTCDKLVTIYCSGDNCMGDSQFYVYPSTTDEQLHKLIREAIAKAKLIHNKPYPLPGDEEGVFTVESNFDQFSPHEIAAQIANTIFDANTMPQGTLNSVEIFITRHTETVCNSRGIHKSQTRYNAMVETIPTYSSSGDSVELYHQYNFSHLDPDAISEEIRCKMAEVKARYEAITPEQLAAYPVIFNIQELSDLVAELAWDLEYGNVYSQSNHHSKGDHIQPDRTGDSINITMQGQIPRCVRSTCFDSDGLSLKPVSIITDGIVTAYHGSNQYGHYLNETPTGRVSCISLMPGNTPPDEFMGENTIEIVSMSGLQVDLSNDYIGGEIRLAYIREKGQITPVTGISISGSLREVLNSIRLSQKTNIFNGYFGPEKAITDKLHIY